MRQKNNRTILVVGAVLVTLISWLGVIDGEAIRYVNSATVQALTAFASARGINAIVTLLSSLEVHVSFLGGFGIQPFQVLDPINDLVEQYSSVMKYAIGSLVIQKVLIEIVSTTFFKLVLTVLAGGFVASLYVGPDRYSRIMMKLFLMAALVRLLIVLVVLLNGMVDRAFVNDQTEHNMTVVSDAALEADRTGLSSSTTEAERDEIVASIDQLEVQKVELMQVIDEQRKSVAAAQKEMEASQRELEEFEADMSTLDRHNRFSRSPEHQALIDSASAHRSELSALSRELEKYSKQLERLESDVGVAQRLLSGELEETGFTGIVSNVRNMANVGTLKTKLEDAIVSMLNLMALFVLKTLIMPLVFLGLFLKGFKSIWGIDPREWVAKEMSSIKSGA